MIESEYSDCDRMIAGRKLLKAESGIGGDHGRATVQVILQDSLLNAALRDRDGRTEPDSLDLHFDGGSVLRGV